MVQEIRKEVIGLLDRWNQGIKRFSVKLAALLVSIWIAAVVLGIGIMGPVYLVKLFLKGSGSKIVQTQVFVRERLRASVPRYEPAYRIQGSPVRNERTLRNSLREARNTASEFRSLSRAVSAFGKA